MGDRSGRRAARWVGLVALACGLVAGCAFPARGDEPASVPTSRVVTRSAAGTVTTPPKPDVFTTGLKAPHTGEAGLWMAWSVIDRADGRRIGSPNSATERTNAESSMKAWISADRLRADTVAGKPLSAANRQLIERAIRASDDQAAEQLYRQLGADQVLRDLNSVCGIPVATNRRGYWSYAQVDAQDSTNILDCVLDKAPTYADGKVLVDALHGVDPEDAFGIPQALPPGTSVAVKNGWTAHSATGLWDMDCVASWDHYTMAVLVRYPIGRGQGYGAGVCKDVAAAFLAKAPA